MPVTVKLGGGSQTDNSSRPAASAPKNADSSAPKLSRPVVIGIVLAVWAVLLGVWMITRSGGDNDQAAAPISAAAVPASPAPPGFRTTPGGMGSNGPIIPGPGGPGGPPAGAR